MTATAEAQIITTDDPNTLIAFGDEGLMPKDLAGIIHLSGVIARSGLAPKGMDTPEKIAVVIMYGRELGLSIMQSIQNIANINGRPSVWGDMALALCKAHPDYEWYKEGWGGEGEDDPDAFHGWAEAKAKGNDHVVRRTFSIHDAKRANLWTKLKTPWITYPTRMLLMRARGFALRDTWPGATRGLSIAEEVIGIDGPMVQTAAAPLAIPQARRQDSSEAEAPAAAMAPPPQNGGNSVLDDMMPGASQ